MKNKEVREFLEKQVEEKRAQVENLQNSMIECDNKEERVQIGETLKKYEAN